MTQWMKCSNNRLKQNVFKMFSLCPETGKSSDKVIGNQIVRCFSRTNVVLATNLYETLGISKGATQQEIKNAYYRLSLEYHPDKNVGCQEAVEKFRQITEAYEVLGNFRARKLYDKGIGSYKRAVQTHHEHTVHTPMVVEEEDDAQTKFYKQHMRRSQRPDVVGRNTSFDFDEWTSKSISESFHQSQSIKRSLNIERSTQEQDPRSDGVMILCTLVVIFFGVVCILSYELKDYKKR